MNSVEKTIPFKIKTSTKQRLVSIGFDPEYEIYYDEYYKIVRYEFTLSSEFDKYFTFDDCMCKTISISKFVSYDYGLILNTVISSAPNFNSESGSCFDIEIEGKCSSDDELLNKYIDKYFPKEINYLHETILNLYRNSEYNKYLREEYRF